MNRGLKPHPEELRGSRKNEMPAKDQGMADRAGESQIRREFQEHTRKLCLNLLRDPVKENRNVSIGSSNIEILNDPEKFHRSDGQRQQIVTE